MPGSVSLVTLGCARNDVDSEELAARLEADGWQLASGPDGADVLLVNTCGFVEPAKRDSIDTILAASDTGRPVVAVGCLAERYGEQLAAELPEATILGFDDYAAIGERLDDAVAGRPHPAHRPRDRRRLLPISPARRAVDATDVGIPGHAGGPRGGLRRRLDNGPVAPLKLASGCDRRCAFCAIPRFRGSFVSRRPDEVVADARWLAERGVRELYLVSENSTSYGKDLGDIRALERLLPRLAAVDGIARVRVSYLQPAELRPSLVDVMTGTPGVAAYFDLSFQHASAAVLRRMRRFGDTDKFLQLLDAIRQRSPRAGVRSNVIVGFPGETEADVAELERFLAAARLDAVGVFGYSDEDGTEAATLPRKLPAREVATRTERISSLVDELVTQRGEDRVGETVTVLLEGTLSSGMEGRAEHQAPEVDGTVTVTDSAGAVGRMVDAVVTGSDGADLLARPA